MALEGRLRVTHLAAHLEVTELLDEEQREAYDRLRGYGGEVPEGHDPEMWKKHHGGGGEG